ncbi:hypothetical protein GN956_G18137 [Arapaima gigas]
MRFRVRTLVPPFLCTDALKRTTSLSVLLENIHVTRFGWTRNGGERRGLIPQGFSFGPKLAATTFALLWDSDGGTQPVAQQQER